MAKTWNGRKFSHKGERSVPLCLICKQPMTRAGSPKLRCKSHGDPVRQRKKAKQIERQ